MSPAESHGLDGAKLGVYAENSMDTMQISGPRSEQLFKRTDNADHYRLCECSTLLLCECAWSTHVVGPNRTMKGSRIKRFDGTE